MDHLLLSALRGKVKALVEKTTERSMAVNISVERLIATNHKLFQRLIGAKSVIDAIFNEVRRIDRPLRSLLQHPKASGTHSDSTSNNKKLEV